MISWLGYSYSGYRWKLSGTVYVGEIWGLVGRFTLEGVSETYRRVVVLFCGERLSDVTDRILPT
jgi:hypothetical protein